MTVKLDTLVGHKVQLGDVVRFHCDGNPNQPSSDEQTITRTSPEIETLVKGDTIPSARRSHEPLWSVVRRASQKPEQAQSRSNPFIEERVERFIKRGTFGTLKVKAFTCDFINLDLEWSKYRPTELRTLAKQLTDLADAHEAIYPPQAVPNLDHL